MLGLTSFIQYPIKDRIKWSILKNNVRNSLIGKINQTYNLDILKLIIEQALYFNLEPKWVWAMFEVESGWNAEATRFESKFCDKLRLQNPTMSEESLRKRSTSWGLGQILGQTALEIGYPTTIDISELTNPTNGVHYSLKYLQRKKRMYPKMDIFAWIASYNAGIVRLDSSGAYINQYHVDKFRLALNHFETNPL